MAALNFALFFIGLKGVKCSSDSSRVDCLPESGLGLDECLQRGCVWSESSVEGAPWCFYPEEYPTYQVVNQYEGEWAMGSKVRRFLIRLLS